MGQPAPSAGCGANCCRGIQRDCHAAAYGIRHAFAHRLGYAIGNSKRNAGCDANSDRDANYDAIPDGDQYADAADATGNHEQPPEFAGWPNIGVCGAGHIRRGYSIQATG
jgi:hypothetical protein